ncbi:hypothetical protein BGX20_001378, partial [Mortierella sp. AD010]
MKNSGLLHSSSHDRRHNIHNINDSNNTDSDNNNNSSSGNIGNNTGRTTESITARSNAMEYLNSTDPSRRRSSTLSLLHGDSASNLNSSSNDKTDDKFDFDNSSPSGHFPHLPSQTLSQRFNHESDSENDYDEDHDDSDRTEGDMSPYATKAKPKSVAKRPPAI